MSSSPSSLPGIVTVSKVSSADLPALVEAELLSFNGLGDGDARARTLHPFRADLIRAGISPHCWPDFAPTVRSRKRTLREARALLFKAELAGGDGAGNGGGEASDLTVVAGMAWLTPPARLVEQKGGRASKLWESHLRPTLDRLGAVFWPEGQADGTDMEFKRIFYGEMARARQEVLKGRDELMYTHPSHRQRRVGASLLAHCIALADAARLPLLLESSPSGTPLYMRFGFTEVYRSRVEYRGEVFEWPVMMREAQES
ncbi:hypothetical protein DFH11DRAFT_1505314 [Phellopilus nigrolimitatus]|nr:hypothetical protein DFH11DRAFT_1505314 [Phellopilus nigrolimitatus]